MTYILHFVWMLWLRPIPFQLINPADIATIFDTITYCKVSLTACEPRSLLTMLETILKMYGLFRFGYTGINISLENEISLEKQIEIYCVR